MKNLARTQTELDRRLGQRLRARRLEVGLSLERLAEILGVTFQQVQKYERGVNRVAASRLADIASALEAPVSYFFDGELAASTCDASLETLASPDGQRLVRAYRAIANPETRRRVVDLLETMAQNFAPNEQAR